MLVSAVQHHELAIYIYMYLLPLEPPSHPISRATPLGCRRVSSWAPCAIQQRPASSLFSVRLCMYENATLSVRPPSPSPLCPQNHSLCLLVYSYPADRFISIIFLDSTLRTLHISSFKALNNSDIATMSIIPFHRRVYRSSGEGMTWGKPEMWVMKAQNWPQFHAFVTLYRIPSQGISVKSNPHFWCFS